jgi:hypothetical protein
MNYTKLQLKYKALEKKMRSECKILDQKKVKIAGHEVIVALREYVMCHLRRLPDPEGTPGEYFRERFSLCSIPVKYQRFAILSQTCPICKKKACGHVAGFEIKTEVNKDG